MSSKMSSERPRRVLHGGAWYIDSRCWRSAYRNTFPSGYHNAHCGFRLVAKAETQFKLLHSGSWYSLGGHCRAAIRIAVRPGYRDPHFGFRLVAR